MNSNTNSRELFSFKRTSNQSNIIQTNQTSIKTTNITKSVIIQGVANQTVVSKNGDIYTIGTVPSHNFTATNIPNSSNDSSEGYSIGSRWIYSVINREYVCTDATIGAAVWNETTNNITNYVLTDSTTASTVSTVYITLPSMSLIPPAGTYNISFSTSMGTNASAEIGYCIIYVGAATLPHTERRVQTIRGTNVIANIHTQAIVSVNGSEVVEIQYKCATATNIDVYSRSIILLKME